MCQFYWHMSVIILLLIAQVNYKGKLAKKLWSKTNKYSISDDSDENY